MLIGWQNVEMIQDHEHACVTRFSGAISLIAK